MYFVLSTQVFRKLTNMDHYTIIVFCSFSQIESFRSALLENGCYYVARNFWIKTGGQDSTPHNLFKNCIEAYLVAFGTKTTDFTPRDWQINWNVNDDLDPDAGEVNRRNYSVTAVVEKMASYDGKVRE